MIPFISFKTGQALRRPNDGWRLADPIPMRPRTRRAFRALIRALCPPEPIVPGMTDRIEEHARRTMRYMHPLISRGMTIAMHILNWSPVWMGKNTRCLDALPRQKGERHLDRFTESRSAFLRLLLLGIRSTVLAIYFDQPEVHRELDYDPGPFFRERIAKRKAHA